MTESDEVDRLTPPPPPPAPNESPPPPPPASHVSTPSGQPTAGVADMWRASTQGTKLLAGGVVAAGIGVLMPWARAPFVGSISGIDTGDGQLFTLLIVGLGVLTFQRFRNPDNVTRTLRVLALVVAVAAVALTVYEIANFSNEEFLIVAGGLYVSAGGSIAAAIGAIQELKLT